MTSQPQPQLSFSLRKVWMKQWITDIFPSVEFEADCYDYFTDIKDKDVIIALINKTLMLKINGYSPIGLYHLYTTIAFSADLYHKLGLPGNGMLNNGMSNIGIPLWHELCIKQAIYLNFDNLLKSNSANYQLLFNYLTYMVCSIPHNVQVKALYDSSKFVAPLEKVGDVATYICGLIASACQAEMWLNTQSHGIDNSDKITGQLLTSAIANLKLG